MADVWDNGPEDPTERHVLLYLANRCDDAGGNCFPSIATISEKTRFSERTVQRALASLQKGDFMTVIRGTGRGNPSQYKINTLAIKGCHTDTKPQKTKRVTLTTLKGDTGSLKGDKSAKPPHPLKGRNTKIHQETPNTPPVAKAPGQHTAEEEEEMIYQAYPRKVGKAAALKAIRSAVKKLAQGLLGLEPMEPYQARRFLCKMALTYAKSPAGAIPTDCEDYRPHPATWFNQARYLDDIEEWKKSRNGVHTNGNGKYTADPEREARLKAIAETGIAKFERHPAQSR